MSLNFGVEKLTFLKENFSEKLKESLKEQEAKITETMKSGTQSGGAKTPEPGLPADNPRK